MRRFLFPLIVLAVALGYMMFRPGDDPSDIEELFDRMAEAARAKDLEGVMEGFSLQYKDGSGASYPVVKNIVSETFEKYGEIDAAYSDFEAFLSADEHGNPEAYISVGVVVTAADNGETRELLGSPGRPERINVTLKYSAISGWKIDAVEGLDGERP
ncbi:MAG TPA: hypothetical protein PKC29_05090 [Thermodesulfobacteriota bacterium]|nr:hypothetical protein [Thermodesulfobacteriota bacterium]